MVFIPRLIGSATLSVLVFLLSFLGVRGVYAQEDPFPRLPGLEASVEFWKLVFTRYSASQLIFHDPDDPLKIYRVLEGGENPSPKWIDGQRRKVISEYGLGEGEKRVRVQRGVKERIALGLEVSSKYLDQIQQIFREEGIPEDLAYLALVESAFNLHARSRAGAVGMWQFMPATGKNYLKVNSVVDERKHLLQSTRAAARFLKENHQILGNWPLAITAYNHGREGIRRAVSQVGSTDLVEIIRRYDGRAFGFASKSFYAEFLAAVEVAKNSEEFFPALKYHPPLRFEEVLVERAIAVATLLRTANILPSEFFDWNPALNKRARNIPAGYRIKVPTENLERVQTAYLHAIGKPPASRRTASLSEGAISWIRHQVARGETLSKIARIYQVPVHELQRVNELSDVHSITAGEYLTVPLR
jgi:membrane-bound lytic murein transglycosylase D